MSVFLMIAGAMLLLALSLVLPPLLHRRRELPAQTSADLNLALLREQRQELDAQLGAGQIDDVEFRAARAELLARAAQDLPAPAASPSPGPARRQTAAAVSVALVVTVLSGFLYAMLGNPNRLRPAAPRAAGEAQIGPVQIEAMVARLAARLKNEPGDAEGWRRLARSYETLRRFEPGADAYLHLLALEPDNADVTVDYAVVLGMTQGGKLAGEPEALLNQVLNGDTRHLQALALAGSAALERGDKALARERFNTILKLVPADSPMAQSVRDGIASASESR
ncbi:MAG: c-type cytochrome biogenesis protein CcmI [Massilia sp.]